MSDLAIYGRREDVLALSQRLQATIPGGRKLTQDEALSLAQLTVSHGLDPFNGEAWIIPGSGLMVGIKGLRKAAKREADREDGVFWTEFVPVSPETYGEPETSVVWECRLRDTITTQAWAKSISMMTEAGVPYKDAILAVGQAPVKVGIGIASPKESSKMPIHQRAKKRAEADAIKQRYDVALNAEFSDEEPEIVEAKFEVDKDNGDKPRDEATILEELGFSQEKTEEAPTESQPELLPETNWSAIYQAVVDAGYSENIHAAMNTLQNYCRSGYDTVEKALAWMKLYRAWRDMDKTPQQAGKLANEGTVPK